MKSHNILIRLKDILSRYQKYLLVFALVFSSIAISIRSSDGEINFVLRNHPDFIFLLVIISSVLVVTYFQINRREISRLTNQIREQSKIKSEGADLRLRELTERQREVYDLVISGKTNKEIMTELYIEQSTLKSHINQIYKKTNIKSRGELKSKVKY